MTGISSDSCAQHWHLRRSSSCSGKIPTAAPMPFLALHLTLPFLILQSESALFCDRSPFTFYLASVLLKIPLPTSSIASSFFAVHSITYRRAHRLFQSTEKCNTLLQSKSRILFNILVTNLALHEIVYESGNLVLPAHAQSCRANPSTPSARHFSSRSPLTCTIVPSICVA